MGPLLLSLFLLLNAGVAVAQCPDVCTADYTPVCGSDYKTYSNLCALNVKKCQSESSLAVLFNGDCSCREDIACTEEYQAHCGTDGTTYDNRCYFAKAKLCSTTGLGLAYIGKCGNTDVVDQCSQACTLDYSPVCGTDFKTYGNLCHLNVEKCKSTTGLDLASLGECGNSAGGAVRPLAAILGAATWLAVAITN